MEDKLLIRFHEYLAQNFEIIFRLVNSCLRRRNSRTNNAKSAARNYEELNAREWRDLLGIKLDFINCS